MTEREKIAKEASDFAWCYSHEQMIKTLERYIKKAISGEDKSYYRDRIKERKAAIEAIKNGTAAIPIGCKPHGCPAYKRMIPGSGLLGIIQAVAELNAKGVNPTGKALMDFVNLRQGTTSKHSEQILSLVQSGMLKNKKGYYVTNFGYRLMKAWGC